MKVLQQQINIIWAVFVFKDEIFVDNFKKNNNK